MISRVEKPTLKYHFCICKKKLISKFVEKPGKWQVNAGLLIMYLNQSGSKESYNK
jgi:hypothetical protein